MTGDTKMQKYYELADKLWRDLCVIPAPSHHEDERVKYICGVLSEWGINAEADEAKNVIVKFEGEISDTVVFEAHTDVVFPDTEALPFYEDEKNVYCPGCGDDTVEVALLMATVKYIKDSGRKPKNTLLIVFNSCEEGLGNLDGTRAIMKKYGKDVTAFYTFDGTCDEIYNFSVGSHRYRVKVKTEGGHSYSSFGNKNAAAILAKGISAIYDLKAPQDKGKTTYNVGIISGGTSVNTIAQEAEMLCEYRSESYEAMEYMKKKFEEIFEYMRSLGGYVEVELVGDRPCMKNVNGKKMREMSDMCKKIQEKHSGIRTEEKSASTDCNIPHSMGIPAVCPGGYTGGGAHTREEWVEKASLPKGFEIAKDIVMHYFE